MKMWSSSTHTETGKVRRVNEDAILNMDEQQLWLVADGMGGHADGGYASKLVTQLFADYRASPLPGVCKQRVVQTLDLCNTQLIEKAEHDRTGIVGCTVALLQVRQASILCSWSGDSRIYRFRENTFQQLTRDHSLQCVIEDRDQRKHPHPLHEPSQLLTSAIGGDPRLSLEHSWYQLKKGDTFLLCTDGLNKEVDDEEIRNAMIHSATGEQLLATLKNLYLCRGARDNVGMVWVGEASP